MQLLDFMVSRRAKNAAATANDADEEGGAEAPDDPQHPKIRTRRRGNNEFLEEEEAFLPLDNIKVTLHNFCQDSLLKMGVNIKVFVMITIELIQNI